ncbi:F-box protein 15 [Silurus asotus]|uniref:F-box protein 15 n=1 Tax=Silurus asotus TaxID=30991 RepID=A0AAD5AVA8_SILAS|nr:F-box protein 15 [Silurus asotus]
MATGRGQFLLSLRQGFERIQPGRHEELLGGSRRKSPTCEGNSSRRRRRRLPPEIILKIFSYLDAASLFSVGFVSRQFHDLANDNVIWYELYACEMSRKKQKPRLCETPDSESPAVQDVPAAVWKKLLFREMGWRRDTVWKKDLRHVNLNTGMPEHTEQVLRNLNVVWEITLTLKGGRRCVYKRSQAFFSDSSVSVCWSYGTWPKIHRVYSVELYGVLDSSTTLLSKPQWRSLISKTLLSRTEKWRCIGTDSLVKLMQFDEGITVGIWRGTWVIAFIMATLHFHRLVERSVLGSLFCPYRAEEIIPLHPEVPQGSGVHGYTVLVLLHNSVRRIMQCRFSPVLCTRDEFCSGYVQLRPLNAGMSEKHAAVSGKISFPWRAGELHGDVKNCCMMTVSVLDTSQRPVWCICSSSALLLNRSRRLNETYDGEQFTLRYRDSDGKLNMTLVCMQDLQLYFLIGLHIWIRAEKVNMLLI